MNHRMSIRALCLQMAGLFLAGVLLLQAGCSSSRQATSEVTLRVMTWNIHHGEGTDGTLDVDRIAKVIVDEKVDVVALQEIDRGVERSKKLDLITQLADKTDLTYAFGKTIEFQGGEYGNGFLTRYPILEERNLLFSDIPGKERRGVLLLVLDYRGQEFVVATTHLDHQGNDSARIVAVAELESFLRRYQNRPVLLCGDMNDVPGSRTINQITETMIDSWAQVGNGTGFTFPSTSPQKRIDFIFCSKEKRADSLTSPLQLKVRSARVLRSSASDHLPLIVDFSLTTEH